MDCLEAAADEAAEELKKIEAEIQEESKIDPYEKICIKRMLVPRVIWFDEFLPDFWFLIKNEHPLLSIRFASKRHPYTRGERFWNLLMCVCLSFFFAGMCCSTRFVRASRSLGAISLTCIVCVCSVALPR